jgi:APA family basic amino acid/polyamine antiporter
MAGYVPRVTRMQATMLVVGGIIGSGIFLNPAVVAARAGTSSLVLTAWLMGGVVAVLGGLIFAELGARHPAAGGGYVYLREAFGELPAFLHAWTLLLVVGSGAIAAVAMTCASYALAVLGLSASWTGVVAVGVIVVLTGINVAGIQQSAVTTTVFTVLKLLALAFLILAGLGADLAGRFPPLPDGRPPASPALALAGALVPVLFAYGGWQQTNFLAEELIDPVRNLPRALLTGVGVVVAIYVLANVVYLRALGPGGLAESSAPAADTMQLLLGPAGRSFIGASIALSTFGFANLAICANARVCQAMAADGLFLEPFARLHPRLRTPYVSLAALGAWSVALALSGSYGALLDYVVFGDWIFFGLTAATLVVFRRRDQPGSRPPFAAPLWWLATLLFVAAAAYVVVGSVSAAPANALRGAALILAGVPMYLWRRRRHAGGDGA